MTHRPTPRLARRIVALLMTLALAVFATGCAADTRLKNPASDWEAMLTKIVEAAGSDQVTELRAFLQSGLRARIRTASGEHDWSIADPNGQPTDNGIVSGGFTSAGTIAASEVDWTRLEQLATSVEDCNVWAGAVLAVYPGGHVLDFQICQLYVAGTASLDGMPMPDGFAVNTAAGIDDFLVLARELAPQGEALVYQVLSKGIDPQVHIFGPLWEDVPAGPRGNDPCYSMLRFTETLSDESMLALRSGCWNEPPEDVRGEVGVAFDLNRLDGATVMAAVQAVEEAAWWPRTNDATFSLLSRDGNTLEASLTYVGPPDPSKPSSVSVTLPLPA